MTPEHISTTDPRMQPALEELKELLRARYPEVTFTVYQGEDPEGVYLSAVVDVEDTDEVLDVVMDRLMHFQVDQALPVYVMPTLPLARVAEQLRARNTQRGSTVLPHLFQG
jgi:hypothetical protein